MPHLSVGLQSPPGPVQHTLHRVADLHSHGVRLLAETLNTTFLILVVMIHKPANCQPVQILTHARFRHTFPAASLQGMKSSEIAY